MSDLSFDDVDLLISNLHTLNKTLYYLLEQKTKECGLLPDQARLLYILKNHQDTNQQALAAKLKITKATLSVRLQRLEKLGYLTREQSSNDKRNYKIRITDKGELFFNVARNVINKQKKYVLEGISEEQIKVLNDVLNTMIKNIEKCKGDQ